MAWLTGPPAGKYSEVGGQVQTSDPAAWIIGVAPEWPADLTVIDVSGAGRRAGEVARKIVDHLPGPVLEVRPRQPDPGGALSVRKPDRHCSGPIGAAPSGESGCVMGVGSGSILVKTLGRRLLRWKGFRVATFLKDPTVPRPGPTCGPWASPMRT